MRKTKIVCTLGPKSNSKDKIYELVKAGMDVARLNFSDGEYKEYQQIMENIREIEDETGKTIGIMLDTKGPEIRTGKVKNDEVVLKSGDEIILRTTEIQGNSSRVSVSYDKLPQDIEPGSQILVDDGLIELKVLDIENNEIKCKIINGGKLGSKKGINIPEVSLTLPALTEVDKKDIRFGIEMDINFVAASFIRKAKDVVEIRELLKKENAGNIYIISKIENQKGVDNIDEILDVSDGIMIARGDLGVEIPPEQVPVIQKKLIRKCNQTAKPVITATQMLNSMINNPRPTRAEASDVANAIFDGTDATAIGNYAVDSVRTMDTIAREIETSESYQGICTVNKNPASTTVTEAISFASCKTAMDLGAQCIITSTNSGLTARMVSKNRPLPPIIAVTPNKFVKHFLTLAWGVYPLQVVESKTTDEMIDNAIAVVKEHDLVEEGDLVTITAGVPVGVSGTTNLIEVIDV